MCSVRASDPDFDRTARARIRDAALALFGERGFDGTGMRAIAADAGVSPALVIHHFGSKQGLREACDEHVAAVIRDNKHRAMSSGPPDPFQLLRSADTAQPLLRYVARMLVDGSAGVENLVDTMISDAVEYMSAGVESGVLRPSEMPYERVVLLCIWQLGSVALHSHVKRLLDVDLLGDPAAIIRWGRPAVELFTHGLFTDDRWEKALAAMEAEKSRGETEQEASK
ncbi:MAG TPA: TetR family transcriptional regulator [Actinomycetota bacterium]|nr:TetR family transcriptional regulator [Actinomycetota bacterium]